MKKLTNRSIFRKVIKIIDGIIGTNLRKADNVYKYSKSYSGRDHVLAMLFFQLSNSSGLRDFDSKYKNSKKLSKEINVPTYSQLSRLNKYKTADTFRKIFIDLLDKAENEIKSNIQIRKFNDIKIIDSSVITISSNLAPQLDYEAGKAQVRMSTLFSYGTKIPFKVTVVPGKIGERSCIENYTEDKKSIYLFDKGYYGYAWFDELSESKVKFVTRQRKTAITEICKIVDTHTEDVQDYVITMGVASKNKTRKKYREILYFEPNSNEEFKLVTNIFNLKAQDIISLYKKRWDIELFFKWIKQHLSIKRWIGRTLNSVSIQIYSSLIIYILLLLIKKRFNLHSSLFDILRTIRGNLLESYSLKNIFPER